MISGLEQAKRCVGTPLLPHSLRNCFTNDLEPATYSVGPGLRVTCWRAHPYADDQPTHLGMSGSGKPELRLRLTRQIGRYECFSRWDSKALLTPDRAERAR
jgi:hypothetical protein